MDRSIWEDSVFERALHNQGIISDVGHQAYTMHLDTMNRLLLPPQVVVYLAVTPERTLKRIKSRGRDFEQDISLEYLRHLYDEYQHFLERMGNLGSNIVVIQWDDFGTPEDVLRAFPSDLREMVVQASAGSFPAVGSVENAITDVYEKMRECLPAGARLDTEVGRQQFRHELSIAVVNLCHNYSLVPVDVRVSIDKGGTCCNGRVTLRIDDCIRRVHFMDGADAIHFTGVDNAGSEQGSAAVQLSAAGE